MSDNTTVEDMVRPFTGDGITIPQISDTFKVGPNALAGWSMGSNASRRMGAMQAMILTHEQASPWWPGQTGTIKAQMVVSIHRGTGNNGGGTDHHNGRIDGADSTQSGTHQRVPVKLLRMPSNRGGWTWPEVPKIAEPLGPVDDGAVGWIRSYAHYIWWKPKKKRKLKATWRREEEATVLRWAIWAQRKNWWRGKYTIGRAPEEPTNNTRPECHQAQLPMMYQWNRDEEDLIEKKKKKKKKKTFCITSQTSTTNMPRGEPVRQLNCSGVATQAEPALLIQHQRSKSCLLHWELYIFQYIYMCTKSCKWKKKREEREKIQVLYILPHTPRVACLDVPRRGECKGAHWDPLVYICLYWGLRIYS